MLIQECFDVALAAGEELENLLLLRLDEEEHQVDVEVVDEVDYRKQKQADPEDADNVDVDVRIMCCRNTADVYKRFIFKLVACNSADNT